MENQTVGVIGLGAMGAGISASLIRAGYGVCGFDVSHQACETAAAGGVRIVSDPAAAASGATLAVIVVVRTNEQAESVLTGPGGVINGASPGLPVVISSTLSPSRMRVVVQRLRAAGLRPLSAALSGGPWGAAAGTLTFMVSGASDAVSEVAPLLEAAGSKLVVVSEQPEVAQAAKLAVQLIYGVNMMGVFEALRLGAAFGVDHHALQDIFCHSVADSWVARNWEHVREWWEGDGNGLDILLKDLRAVLNEADDLALSLPTTALSFDLMRAVWPAFGGSFAPMTGPATDPVAWD